MKSIDNEKVIVVFPMHRRVTGPAFPLGSMMEVAKHAHVHLSNGDCIKNRYALRCTP